MGLGPSLSIRQSQQLVLTPQLRQAIQLLQLSNLELDAFIAEELAKNPLLEAGQEEPSEQPVRRLGFRRARIAMNRPKTLAPTILSLDMLMTTDRSTSTGRAKLSRLTASPTS